MNNVCLISPTYKGDLQIIIDNQLYRENKFQRAIKAELQNWKNPPNPPTLIPLGSNCKERQAHTLLYAGYLTLNIYNQAISIPLYLNPTPEVLKQKLVHIYDNYSYLFDEIKLKINNSIFFGKNKINQILDNNELTIIVPKDDKDSLIWNIPGINKINEESLIENIKIGTLKENCIELINKDKVFKYDDTDEDSLMVKKYFNDISYNASLTHYIHNIPYTLSIYSKKNLKVNLSIDWTEINTGEYLESGKKKKWFSTIIDLFNKTDVLDIAENLIYETLPDDYDPYRAYVYVLVISNIFFSFVEKFGYIFKLEFIFNDSFFDVLMQTYKNYDFERINKNILYKIIVKFVLIFCSTVLTINPGNDLSNRICNSYKKISNLTSFKKISDEVLGPKQAPIKPQSGEGSPGSYTDLVGSLALSIQYDLDIESMKQKANKDSGESKEGKPVVGKPQAEKAYTGVFGKRHSSVGKGIGELALDVASSAIGDGSETDEDDKQITETKYEKKYHENENIISEIKVKADEILLEETAIRQEESTFSPNSIYNSTIDFATLQKDLPNNIKTAFGPNFNADDIKSLFAIGGFFPETPLFPITPKNKKYNIGISLVNPDLKIPDNVGFHLYKKKTGADQLGDKFLLQKETNLKDTIGSPDIEEGIKEVIGNLDSNPNQSQVIDVIDVINAINSITLISNGIGIWRSIFNEIKNKTIIEDDKLNRKISYRIGIKLVDKLWELLDPEDKEEYNEKAKIDFKNKREAVLKVRLVHQLPEKLDQITDLQRYFLLKISNAAAYGGLVYYINQTLQFDEEELVKFYKMFKTNNINHFQDLYQFINYVSRKNGKYNYITVDVPNTSIQEIKGYVAKWTTSMMLFKLLDQPELYYDVAFFLDLPPLLKILGNKDNTDLNTKLTIADLKQSLVENDVKPEEISDDASQLFDKLRNKFKDKAKDDDHDDSRPPYIKAQLNGDNSSDCLWKEKKINCPQVLNISLQYEEDFKNALIYLIIQMINKGIKNDGNLLNKDFLPDKSKNLKLKKQPNNRISLSILPNAQEDEEFTINLYKVHLFALSIISALKLRQNLLPAFTRSLIKTSATMNNQLLIPNLSEVTYSTYVGDPS